MSNPINDLKNELLAAAERQYTTAPERPRRFGGRVVVVRLVLVAATVAVAAAAALVLTVPWSTSPSFLERAEAALTPPKRMILHEKWVTTSISRHPRCRVTSTTELWLDANSERVGLRRYRAVLPGPPSAPWSASVFRDVNLPPRWCSRKSPWEIGGTVDGRVIRFVPPNRLVDTGLGGSPPGLVFGEETGGDPVAALRRAIRTGHAHDEGRTKRDGRTVKHIRLTWVDGSGDAYVDPDTYYPVELDLSGTTYVIATQAGFQKRVSPRQELRFKAYEYLPRTAANVALTDIRAQHPHATGP